MMLLEIMNKYFQEDLSENFKPITSFKNKNWEKSKNRLIKKYKFIEQKKYERFIVEVLKYSRENTSEIEVRFKNLEVGIIIKSFSPDISSVDLKNSKEIDKIKKDINYYFRSEEQ